MINYSICEQNLCIKSVRIWSNSGPHFPAFGLNKYLSVFLVSLRIQSECVKMQTRINPNTETFYAVKLLWRNNSFKFVLKYNTHTHTYTYIHIKFWKYIKLFKIIGNTCYDIELNVYILQLCSSKISQIQISERFQFLQHFKNGTKNFR